MFCSSCGTRIADEEAAFCPKCGFQLGSSGKGGQSSSARNEKRKPRGSSEKSFYEILEIPRDAEQSVIQEAIKKQRTLWSSRVARGGSMGENARQIVNIIGEAEKTLLDASKRAEYDKSLIDVPDYYEEMPASERNWLETLYAYYDQEDWEVAEKAIERARSQHKDDPEFWFLAAQVYLELGNFQKAGDAAQQVLLLEPENPAAYGIRGDVYIAKGQESKALEMYNKMKALAKDSETRKVAEESILVGQMSAETEKCRKLITSSIPESFEYNQRIMDCLKSALAATESCKASVQSIFSQADSPSVWLQECHSAALQDIGDWRREVQRLIDEGNEPVRLPGFWQNIAFLALAVLLGLCFMGASLGGGLIFLLLFGGVFVFRAFYICRKPRYKAGSAFMWKYLH